MSTKESPDHDEESGDAAPGSWRKLRMSWSVMAARCHVSGSEEEGIIVICINNGAKPHNLATRQIKTSRGVFNHRSITVQLPSPLPPPGSVSDMHTATWAQSRTLDSGLILRWSSKKKAKGT